MATEWEYRAVSMMNNAGGSHAMEALNSEGKDGWELVQILSGEAADKLSGINGNVVAIYKRPVEE